MRAAILFAPLLAALSAMAAPASEGTLLARQDGGKTLRIIFSEKYCVVPTGTSPRTGCPVDEQQVGSPVVGQDWTATIEGHEVSIVHLTCNLYTCEDVVRFSAACLYALRLADPVTSTLTA